MQQVGPRSDDALSEKYHLLGEGTNELTAKLSCDIFHSIQEYYAVNYYRHTVKCSQDLFL